MKSGALGLQDAVVAHLTVGGPHGRTGPGNIFWISLNDYTGYGLPFDDIRSPEECLVLLGASKKTCDICLYCH